MKITVITGSMINGQNTIFILIRSCRSINILIPVTISHTNIDDLIRFHQFSNFISTQVIDRGCNLFNSIDSMLIRFHLRSFSIPLTKTSRRTTVKNRFTFKKTLNNSCGIWCIHGKSICIRERTAACHCIETEFVPLKWLLTLTIHTTLLICSRWIKVRNKAFFIAIPPPS